ncbi:MAG: DUF192 domain-containing protein [Elusimicrobiota bacterium]|nr:DUF192 domain-containing protein [Elusimicrobiota bacterium]
MTRKKKTQKRRNKILLIIALHLAGLAVFAFYKYNSSSLPEAVIILPNSQKISVEVASDAKSRQKGLMFKKKLKQDEGMLFVFENNLEKYFWMKNTFIDLDIIFLDGDFIINKIFENVKKSGPNDLDSKIERVSAEGKYILELVAGSAGKHHLRAGLKLEIEKQDSRNKDYGIGIK